MRIVLFGLLAAAFVTGRPAGCFGQEKAASVIVYYIDSVPIHFGLNYLDPQNMASIHVVRDPSLPGQNSGRIYISWKTPHPVFYSLSDIAGMQSIKGVPLTKETHVLYIVDDSVISDPSDIRIDPGYIVQVKATNAADIPYLPKDAPFTVILQIRTKGLYPPRPAQIMIKG